MWSNERPKKTRARLVVVAGGGAIGSQEQKRAFKRWQANRLDADLRKAYKITSKETRKSVAKAKSISVHHLYEELNTKEGEAKIYKIAKTRQRKRMDKQA